MSLLNKIISYELETFNEYKQKRQLFLKKIKNVKLNNLNNDQLLSFIDDIKNVIDPIKSSIEFINIFLENKHFKKDYNNFILFYLLFGDFFKESSELSLSDPELSDPELSDPELSDPELELNPELSEPELSV